MPLPTEPSDIPGVGPGASPGSLMTRDIADQPAVLEAIATAGMSEIAAVAAEIRARSPRFVLLVARGTSDHAALYAKYLVEIRLGLPAGLASPSTFTVYGARPDLRDVLVIGVSQSGGSPDLVDSVRAARDCGAITVAVTNNAASELAHAAQLHVDVLAGTERAVAATKTYTAELLALYLLVEAIRTGDVAAAAAGVAGIPGATETLIADASPLVTKIAPRYRFAERLITTARGYGYPTAREAALKLMETCYLSALAFSAADLLHGPLAVVDHEMPVIAIVGTGAVADAMRPVLDRLAGGHADLLVVGTGGERGSFAGIELPEVSDALSPILQIVPLQLLARDLAVVRGGNPDAPRGLKKVTHTW